MYCKGSQVELKNYDVILSPKVCFNLLANSEYPDEMQHYFQSLFSKVPIYGFPIFKGPWTYHISIY